MRISDWSSDVCSSDLKWVVLASNSEDCDGVALRAGLSVCTGAGLRPSPPLRLQSLTRCGVFTPMRKSALADLLLSVIAEIGPRRSPSRSSVFVALPVGGVGDASLSASAPGRNAIERLLPLRLGPAGAPRLSPRAVK